MKKGKIGKTTELYYIQAKSIFRPPTCSFLSPSRKVLTPTNTYFVSGPVLGVWSKAVSPQFIGCWR